MGDVLVIENVYVATVDGLGTEHRNGHLVADGNRIAAVDAGSPPRSWRDRAARTIDGDGCLLTPGLVNTHHHLYQWITRGLCHRRTLFGWLTTLYPVWARLDAGAGERRRRRRTWPGWRCPAHDLDRSPLRLPARRRRPARGRDRRRPPDRPPLPAHPRLDEPRRIGGGLPPDSVVEDHDPILAATPRSTAGTTRRPDAMPAVALAPCSPFSVTGELMRDCAELARAQGRPPAHPPRRDQRRGGVLPADLRPHARGVRRRARLAGPGRVAGALRPPLRR